MIQSATRIHIPYPVYTYMKRHSPVVVSALDIGSEGQCHEAYLLPWCYVLIQATLFHIVSLLSGV